MPRTVQQRLLVVRPLDARLGKVPNVSAAAILDEGLPAWLDAGLPIDEEPRS